MPTGRPVRDPFDVAAAHRWLAGELDGLPDTVPAVSQFAGGASNLTYLLRYPDRDLVLRRPPTGTRATSAHDMAREYRLQRALKPVYPYVPTVRALCRDPGVLGSDFYVMDHVAGTILRGNLPAGMTLDVAAARALSETFVDTLVDLHRVDVGAAGLSDLGRGEGYVARQVAGWTRRYAGARTPNVPRFGRVTSWLAERQPADAASCLIHNDFRLDNLVLTGDDPLRVVGVLDWEMATIGDPLMDLGAALAYWVQADDDPVARITRRQPTHLPGMLTRREVLERYAERSGLAVDDWAFYEVFGLFRLAVIAQQIYYRYHRRQTRNPAFRHFWLVVGYLDWRCRRLIRRAG
ncbi:MAG TPA: phosphotransferase family protein [Catenuloplanes sp.]|jgi:aminoglycoside phosphotransferase (APT) family kinase protein